MKKPLMAAAVGASDVHALWEKRSLLKLACALSVGKGAQERARGSRKKQGWVMSYGVLLCGVVLVFVGCVDLFGATMGIDGGGVARQLTRALWPVAVKLAEVIGSGPKMLRVAGIMLNLLVMTMWIALITIGCSLIYFSSDASVLDQVTRVPVLEYIPQLSFTVSKVGGTGSSVRDSDPGIWWSLYSMAVAMGGTLVVSFTVSFLIPIIQAATTKRVVSHRIFLLGKSPVQILEGLSRENERDDIVEQLFALQQDLINVYEKHRTYPTLHFLVSHHHLDAMALTFTTLDETIALVRIGMPELIKERPRVFEPICSVLTKMLHDLDDIYLLKAKEQDIVRHMDLEKLVEITGCERATWLEKMSEDDFVKRRKLIGMQLRNNGWTWEDVYQTETTKHEL